MVAFPGREIYYVYDPDGNRLIFHQSHEASMVQAQAHLYDILIVGAGPVGLATALTLQQHGVNNILVIDQAHSFRPVGQLVDLLPNGLKALRYIDTRAYEQIKEIGLAFRQTRHQGKTENYWRHKNLNGEILRSISLDFSSWLERYGEGRVSIYWYELQRVLRELLPPEMVRSNCQCVQIIPEKSLTKILCRADEVIVPNRFAHWEMQSSPEFQEEQTAAVSTQELYAKLVVGADGINSTVRQEIYENSPLKDWAKPEYSGLGAIGCLEIGEVAIPILETLEKQYFQGDRLITLYNNQERDIAQPWLILSKKPPNSLGYLLHAPLDLDKLLNLPKKEIIQLGIKTIQEANYPPIFTEIIALSNPSKLIHRPYYIHRANPPVNKATLWSMGRVVLVGDAAHGMPPFAAQGANQGLEDAVVIATLIIKIIAEQGLDNPEIISKYFAQYEEIRRPFMMKMQEATLSINGFSQTEWEEYSSLVYCRQIIPH
jgi:2-polyprenyl-6-methoxyphenol hydroxylase-like FAD-dependent oxidoreductase